MMPDIYLSGSVLAQSSEIPLLAAAEDRLGRDHLIEQRRTSNGLILHSRILLSTSGFGQTGENWLNQCI